MDCVALITLVHEQCRERTTYEGNAEDVFQVETHRRSIFWGGAAERDSRLKSAVNPLQYSSVPVRLKAHLRHVLRTTYAPQHGDGLPGGHAKPGGVP
jgi:hypothetical protein